MSIRLPNSCFVHIPRTGGLWFGEVLKKLEIKHQVLRGDVDSHFTRREMPGYWQQFPAFSFVRHPLAWVKSRWSHCIEHNLVADRRNYGIHRVFDECVRPTLEETIQTIIWTQPGLVGTTYLEMTHNPDSPIPTVLYRTEDLPLAACEALFLFEGLKDYDYEIVLSTPRTNSTATMDKYKLELDSLMESSVLVKTFLSHEKLALEIWNGATKCESA